MTDDRGERIRRLFDEASVLARGARDAFLDAECGDDVALREELEALLGQASDTDDLPVRPVLDALLEADRPGAQTPHPTRIGDYRIERVLGAGGMGIVYEAFDERLRRGVALKLYSPLLGPVEAVTERLLREARAAAAINHPHVVTIYAAGEYEERPFLAMERLEGHTLRAELRQGPLPLDRALRIARGLADGLASIHAAGIVHRDLKPENVFIGDCDRAKILDFGIAAVAADPRTHEAGGRSTPASGTPGRSRRTGTTSYMSPEQVRGEVPDVRSDIFTLGYVLYEMTTGTRPFDRPTGGETRRAIEETLAPPPSRERPDLPPRLDRIILRCLAKSPEARYASATELGVALDRAAAEHAAAGTPSTADADAPQIGRLYTTRFFGRREERLRLADTLEERRLVTIVGLGGSGKTRLAVEVARDVAPRAPDGVFVTELGDIHDPALVPQTLLAAIGAREERGTEHEHTLVEKLRDARALLVVDNCEHLLAATQSLATLLLERCPDLRLLATSRERLELEAESVFHLPPLSTSQELESGVPPAETDAVRLFVNRATLAHPDFQLTPENTEAVIEICRRADGLPLAIELAAAYARLLTPSEIVARMDERLALLHRSGTHAKERHGSLRAIIDWSYRQLSPGERALLRRLTVFRGGWTLEGAEEVCGFGDVSRAGVLELLASLVDRSLIEREALSGERSHTRFRMLETVREHASEELDAEERRSALERHATYFTNSLSEIGWVGPEQTTSIAHLREEEENFRAFFARADELGLTARDVARVIARIAGFWIRTGRWSEGRRRCRDAMARLEREDLGSSWEASEVLRRDGELAQCQGALDEAHRILERALACATERGDARQISSALGNLGTVELFRGNLELARAHYDRCLASAGPMTSETSRKELWDYAGVLLNRGATFARQGRYAEAERDFRESLEVKRRIDDARGIAHALNGLGLIKERQGFLEESRDLLEESLSIKRRLHDHLGTINTLLNLATTAMSEFESIREDPAPLDYVERQLLEAIELSRRIGARPSLVELLAMLGWVYTMRGDHETAQATMAEGIENARAINSALAEAGVVMELAEVHNARGDHRAAWTCGIAALGPQRAAHVPWIIVTIESLVGAALGLGRHVDAALLHGLAERLRDETPSFIAPWRRRRLENRRAEIEDALGDVGARRAISRGRETDVDAVLALVSGSEAASG